MAIDVSLYKTCAVAAGRFSHELKEVMDSAKKEDFAATIQGIVTLAQEVGVLKTCGLELEKADLIKAAIAIYPMNWDVVQEELRSFGESAAEKIMG